MTGAVSTPVPRPRPRSLRRQLTLALMAVFIVLGTITTAGTAALFQHLQTRITEQAISASVELLLAALQKGAQGVYLDTSRLGSVYSQPLSGAYFQIDVNGAVWRSRSLWDSDLQLQGKAGVFRRSDGPLQQQLLVQTRHFKRFGLPVVISAAHDDQQLRAEFTRALWLLSALWLGLSGAVLLGLNLWIARQLQPLQRARQQVLELQSGARQSLDTSAAMPAELLPLIEALNRLLSEVQQALLRSRQALGNLGHALKTPLAVLFALLERDELQRQPGLQQALREQLEQLSGRIQRELGQVQTSSGAIREPFVVGRDLPLLLQTLRRIYPPTVQLQARAQDADTLPFERADILELLGNLLDNAGKWARTMVVVEIQREATHWLLRVSDDGPGIATASARARALQRGQRLDEAVAGQGLGLAIVADIVDAYRGSLSLDSARQDGLLADSALPHGAPQGGLQVTVRLPLAAS